MCKEVRTSFVFRVCVTSDGESGGWGGGDMCGCCVCGGGAGGAA